MNNSLRVVAACLAMSWACACPAAPTYLVGTSPTAASSGLTFGSHLIGGPQTSVAGSGGGGLSAAGSALDGSRTYIFDLAAQPDLTDGLAVRGVAPFAMMIWDMGTAYDSMRLYTHQDHYSGGPVTTPFVAQDLMEYSVWGSDDGDSFTRLSDVIGFDINGGGAGLPTYTFAGTEPSVVYRGGSAEFGIANAYTREYVFSRAYRFYGIRTSQISLDQRDADPEIDAVAAFNAADRCAIAPNDPSCRQGDIPVPEPGSPALVALALLALAWAAQVRPSR